MVLERKLDGDGNICFALVKPDGVYKLAYNPGSEVMEIVDRLADLAYNPAFPGFTFLDAMYLAKQTARFGDYSDK